MRLIKFLVFLLSMSSIPYTISLQASDGLQEKDSRASSALRWTEVEDDVSQAMRVFHMSFSKAYEPFSPEDLKLSFASKKAWLDATFQEEEQDFKAQRSPIWLLQVIDGSSQEIIGVATVEPDHGDSTTTLYVRQMAVNPPYQTKGIGREMMEAIEKRFSAQGFRDIVLLVREVNKPAIDFYTKIGFQPHGYEHPDYVGKPYIGFRKVIPAR